ncbi:hypothetical protein WMF11_31945 [Sorangium sp. So ce295]|uniref:hypothetical protein n=1 Tax=Sorangium sp. So ce295 TaxID=3133295 RepID=UPI003F646BCA
MIEMMATSIAPRETMACTPHGSQVVMVEQRARISRRAGGAHASRLDDSQEQQDACRRGDDIRHGQLRRAP